MQSNNESGHTEKNVLLITVDQWPGNLLGCEGKEDFLSPTLDELAKVGVRFENAYSPTPVCIPARRELMTGTGSKTHGDRKFNEFLELPNVPTIAQAFKDNGYQTFGVGKLHVYPQRARIGFDDVILNEEGRKVNFPNEMREDDYTRFINREGHTGLDFAHGMSNNNYITRPWHLPEELHQTSWTSRQMCEQIIRRDPSKPAFWYCGFTAPHPPIVPPQVFLDMYNDMDIEMPHIGEWAKDSEKYPYAASYYSSLYENLKSEKYIKDARKGFYASCTHIDYSIRSIIGTLRDEKVLDNTIIVITSDHGEMLGNHNLWGKNLFYEDSTRVPLIFVPTVDCEEMGFNTTDERLVELKDIMPTLLDMCNLPIPETVEGISLLNKGNKREYVYGELWEDDRATRMIRNEQFKLIYYSVGNQFQLFDVINDPKEMVDLSDHPEYKNVKQELTDILISRLYGSDLDWLNDGELVGKTGKNFEFKPVQENCGILSNRDLLLQRGIR
ncbi:sulfatase-like hydrolase/transferase [Bacillus sp. Marseille-P3661]|uniref:sulfatase-like hydrolase/transferase n=1 Tax=Bacillus sp. Marseille-P3661 TaxID=1936234 RepID=UPI000C864267|nr:sulfatase-like hydrolase/transferase [Bacillus sp. Marseille-P3661]